MKTEDAFHWHIYICSRLHRRHYYYFILRRRFENFVFVTSARTEVQYYSSSFFYSPTRPGRWKRAGQGTGFGPVQTSNTHTHSHTKSSASFTIFSTLSSFSFMCFNLWNFMKIYLDDLNKESFSNYVFAPKNTFFYGIIF